MSVSRIFYKASTGKVGKEHSFHRNHQHNVTAESSEKSSARGNRKEHTQPEGVCAAKIAAV